MVSAFAVFIAGFLQIVLRTSFFIEQNNDLCSAAPSLASWIFLIAFLDILLDICVYPLRYMHLPYICQIVAETVIAVFLAECGTMVVWCAIEKISCKLCKSLLLLVGLPRSHYYAWESYILGILTTSTSAGILIFACKATDHFYFMRKRSMRLYHHIHTKLSEIWRKRFSMNKHSNCVDVNKFCVAENSDLLAKGSSIAMGKYNKRNRSRRRRSRGRSRIRT